MWSRRGGTAWLTGILDTREVLMHGLFSAKSRTKFVVAAAVLSAAMLAFVGDATAEDTGNVVVMPMCQCAGGCKLVKWCLGNYCYTETVCDKCMYCHPVTTARVTEAPKKVYRMGVRSSSASTVRAIERTGPQLCLYRKGTTCVTHVTTYRRR
jgi:hypothetical protein